MYIQRFWQRNTGSEFVVSMMRKGPANYDVKVDDQFYSNHESRAAAYDEIVDIIKAFNLSPIPLF